METAQRPRRCLQQQLLILAPVWGVADTQALAVDTSEAILQHPGYKEHGPEPRGAPPVGWGQLREPPNFPRCCTGLFSAPREAHGKKPSSAPFNPAQPSFPSTAEHSGSCQGHGKSGIKFAGKWLVRGEARRAAPLIPAEARAGSAARSRCGSCTPLPGTEPACNDFFSPGPR